jgi:hypothetical protein
MAFCDSMLDGETHTSSHHFCCPALADVCTAQRTQFSPVCGLCPRTVLYHAQLPIIGNVVVPPAFLAAVSFRRHPIQPFPHDEQGPNGAGMVGFALAMFREEFHGGRGVNADLFQAPVSQRDDRPFF